MKKFLALIFVLLICSSAFAAGNGVSEPAFAQQKNLGKDRLGLQWWLTEYGVGGAGYYAVAREYFTNGGAKSEIANNLKRYGVPSERAEAIYFAEFRFEYTSDGNQYAELSRVFYDMLGEEICGYRTGHVVFNPITPNSVQAKGVAYATGRIRD